MVVPVEAAPPPRRAIPGGREFQARLVSAIVLAIVVVSALALGGWFFALIWLVAAVVGAAEWIGMSRIEPARPILATTAAGVLVLAVCSRAQASPLVLLALVATGLAVLAVIARDAAARGRAAVGLLAAAVIALVPTALRDDPGIGILGPAWMFAVVWSTDIVAYFTGRTLGGPKLMPAISPKKTWSGALGGLAAGTAAGTGLVLVARDHGWGGLASTPLAVAAVTSGVASILSQAGDLAESALKRRCGVKDSGRSIPGHGGVMDRLDGFFAVALLAGLYLVAHRLGAV